MSGDARLLALRLLARVLPSCPALLAPTVRDLMRTLGNFVWHTPTPLPLPLPPPPPLQATSDCGVAAHARGATAGVAAQGATRGEEDGGQGLCVASVSMCGEGGEWAWGDDAVAMARLPLHGVGVAVTEQRCQAEEVRMPPRRSCRAAASALLG